MREPRLVLRGGFLPLLLVAAAAGCTAPSAPTGFDGERAYRDVETIVGYGPRTPGSSASRRTRDHIRAELAKLGLELQEQTFTADTPIGAVTMTNLLVEIPGTRPEIIVVGNHYDSKVFPDFEFVGANDGGSSTAWTIEFARAIGAKREGHTLWLCWFDGEEAYGEWSATDGLYGSRSFVERLTSEGRLGDIRAMINVDMIGDCDLDVHRDVGATAELLGPIWDAARALGHGRHFTARTISIDDDHKPFRDAGIPAIELIDFRYGGGAVEHQMNWHTTRDRLDLVCAESLQIVGDVLLTALPAIEQRLSGGGE